VLEGTSGSGERVLQEEVAFLATSLLQGAVERGTAKLGKVPGWSVAAKTGTSQDAVDMWFVGFTPTLVAGLWIGYDQPRSLGSHETAGRLVAPVWADFMRRALRGVSPERATIPEGVLSLRVNYRTGLATDAADPEGITEYLLRGETPGAETVTPGPAPAPSSVPIAPLPPGAGDR
jgi:penicillin-binding protein 1A